MVSPLCLPSRQKMLMQIKLLLWIVDKWKSEKGILGKVCRRRDNNYSKYKRREESLYRSKCRN